MKARFGLFKRGKNFYAYDKESGKQESLRTTVKSEAERLVSARNEAEHQRTMNLQIARVYLAASDPEVVKRTWQDVMNEMAKLKRGATLERWCRGMRDKAFDQVRERVLIETRPEHLLRVLEAGTVSTNTFLRRLHNFALDMTWLPSPVLPKKQWPAIHFGEKRAVTFEEHQRIVGIEWDAERKAFYELLWQLGGSQTDIATLRAEDFNLATKTVAYDRHKTGIVSLLHFSESVVRILSTLPHTGLLFPRLAAQHERHRAAEFKRRCKRLRITGITLHSYRYSWAQRAREVGYPERFAQAALGHLSKAVHRAYARNATMELPSLEEFTKNLKRGI